MQCLTPWIRWASTTNLFSTIRRVRKTHAVVPPHVTAYNPRAAEDARTALSRALDDPDLARVLADLTETVGAPGSLADLGVDQTDLEGVAAECSPTHAQPPRRSTRSRLEAAWRGELT